MSDSMQLPQEYLDRYAGKTVAFDGVWSFRTSPIDDDDWGDETDDGTALYPVVTHEYAQFEFAIDDALAIYVYGGRAGWQRIYNHVSDLFVMSEFLAENRSKTERAARENLGYYASIAEFEAVNAEILKDAFSCCPENQDLNKLYVVDGIPIVVGLVYDSPGKFVALKGP